MPFRGVMQGAGMTGSSGPIGFQRSMTGTWGAIWTALNRGLRKIWKLLWGVFGADTFARVSAAGSMKVEDYFVQGRRSWVRLYEKGGKQHEVPAHHNLDEYMEAYIKVAGLQDDAKGLLFRTVAGKTGRLTTLRLSQADAYRMIRRRAKAAGIQTKIGNHTFRATGITAYLKNGGKLEIAQQIAAHESSRTTGLYDRRDDDVNLDEVERIGI